MKIKIAGSMTFAKDMLTVRDELKKLGHEPIVPSDAEEYANPNVQSTGPDQGIEMDIIHEYYDQIKSADAVLVLNKDKYDIPNYIGGNSLIEMAFAHIMEKRIFILNSIPQMSYTHEIRSMQPVILNGDYSLIH